MMEIVVPDRIESVPAFVGRLYHFHHLRFVFGHKIHPAASGGLSDSLRNLAEHMPRRSIEDVLGSIQPKSIEVKLADPVLGILSEIFANRAAVRSIKIKGLTPLRLIAIGEIGR